MSHQVEKALFSVNHKRLNIWTGKGVKVRTSGGSRHFFVKINTKPEITFTNVVSDDSSGNRISETFYTLHFTRVLN